MRPSFAFFLAINKNQTPIGAEIGVDQGLNARMMREHSNIYLHLVDIKEPDKPLGIIDSRFYLEDSVKVAGKFPDAYFDYIYVDGDHSYESVKRDLNAWFPKIKPGGIFAGHDWWMNEVKQSVLEFFKDKPVRLMAVQQLYKTSNGSVLSEDAEQMDWWAKC